jgi:hypothetical protein
LPQRSDRGPPAEDKTLEVGSNWNRSRQVQ